MRFVVLVASFMAACSASQGLRLRSIGFSAQKPANVAVYFTVDTRTGRPVVGVEASAFQILEDGQAIPASESKQALLDPQKQVERNVILLLDMSQAGTRAGHLKEVVNAAVVLTDLLSRHQHVAVYTFDGRDKIVLISDFTSDGEVLRSAIYKLRWSTPRGRSRNLNGAVLAALTALDVRVLKSRAPLAFGTLIVFSTGSDRANSVSAQEMAEAVADTRHDVVTIGLGTPSTRGQLARIGKTGAFFVREHGKLRRSFEDAALLVESRTRRHYLLSYCSPARKGEHTVTIEVSVDGKSGSLSKEFIADGFEDHCDPYQRPKF